MILVCESVLEMDELNFTLFLSKNSLGGGRGREGVREGGVLLKESISPILKYSQRWGCYSKRKEFAPCVSNFFPSRVPPPLSKGWQILS